MEYPAEMELKGHMLEVTFDGSTLTAEGTNKAAQIALRGQERNAGPVVLPVAEIERVEFDKPTLMRNGRVVVHATDQKRYQLHFRKKDSDAFKGLHDALEAARR